MSRIAPCSVVVVALLGGAVGCLPAATGPGADAGPAVDDGPFVVADHPPQPQVIDGGGGVLEHPNVVAVYFNGDKEKGDVTQLLPELQASGYWSQVTSEYGVGDLTVGDAMDLGIPPPKLIDGDTALSMLDGLLGTADPSTIYMIVIPEETEFDDNGGCCAAYDGFHDVATLQGTDVPVSFVCRCQGFGEDPSGIDELAVTISHELVEAATDPFLSAFSDVDDDHLAAEFLGGGEVGDMCEFLPDTEIKVPGIHLPVQRIWSNASAAADGDPCIPTVPDEVAFNTVPVLDDDLSFDDPFAGTFATKGVKIAVGETKTIDLDLYSAAATGRWGVRVFDVNEVFGGKSNLKLELHGNSGSNGDVLHLVATVLSPDPTGFGAEIFIVESDYDTSTTMSVGLIAQQ